MNKKELKQYIAEDKKLYRAKNWKYELFYRITNNQRQLFKKNIILSRKLRFYKEKTGILNAIMTVYYERKYNRIALKSNIRIQGMIGHNLKISHENIIINKYAVVGDNVILHGNNCIGNLNNGKSDCPTIGNGVDIGYGSMIFGGIKIADNIIVGANSFINKDFLEPNVVIAGSPAKIIKERIRE